MPLTPGRSVRAGLAFAMCALAIADCGGTASSSSTTHRLGAAKSPARRGVALKPTTPALTQTEPQPHPLVTGQIPDRLATGRHVVGLTFDAGADNAGAPKILAALARADATATFFMTGRWAELFPQWARRIAALYPIGNHTYDHTDLAGLSLPASTARP